ncbi:MAG: DNA methyltransferase [Candidatus Saccharimonadales bacterium]
MEQTVAVLGRQPALGRAELESLYGAKSMQPVGQQAVIVDLPTQQVQIDRLGGTVKVARLLSSINSTDWPRLIKYIADNLPQYLRNLPEGKVRFGLSVYGLPTKPATIGRSCLELKKIIKRNGRSVRVIPNTESQLNAAQVIHNQLTGPTGLELLLIRHGQKTILAQTTAVQDIAAYAARDQARPKRDAKVGMLPPKLAQTIVNLATGSTPPSAETVVLDPFCGTGVVLQEALLMGYQAYGSDLEPRMIEYSQANLDWLRQRWHLPSDPTPLEAGDATSHHWPVHFEVVAGETYLGRPFSAQPNAEVLSKVSRDVDTILRKFLQNLAKQTAPGLRACLAVPAWASNNGFLHLKTLDSLADLGYTQLSFVHARNDELVYHRPGQVVARQLIVIERK